MTKLFDIIQKVYEGWLIDCPWKDRNPSYYKRNNDLTIDFGNGNYIVFEDHDDKFQMKAYPQFKGIEFSIGITNLIQTAENFISENIIKE